MWLCVYYCSNCSWMFATSVFKCQHFILKHKKGGLNDSEWIILSMQRIQKHAQTRILKVWPVDCLLNILVWINIIFLKTVASDNENTLEIFFYFSAYLCVDIIACCICHATHFSVSSSTTFKLFFIYSGVHFDIVSFDEPKAHDWLDWIDRKLLGSSSLFVLVLRL